MNKNKKLRQTSVCASLKRRVRQLDALLRAGQMCANCCYNLAQERAITERHEPALRESYQAWDKAAVEMRALVPPNQEVSHPAQKT